MNKNKELPAESVWMEKFHQIFKEVADTWNVKFPTTLEASVEDWADVQLEDQTAKRLTLWVPARGKLVLDKVVRNGITCLECRRYIKNGRDFDNASTEVTRMEHLAWIVGCLNKSISSIFRFREGRVC